MIKLTALFALVPVLLFAEPKADPNAIMLPTFVFDHRHAITAGVAFAVEDKGQKFLITAYHILGPAGGLTSKISASDVPNELKAVAALSLGDQKSVFIAQPALLVKDARIFDEAGADADVAVIRIADARPVPSLRLSTVRTKKGDRVWLFARLVDRDRPTLYPARVIEDKPALVQYAFDDPKLNLRALSGAPVLAEDGTVILMHLGYGAQDRQLIGIGSPAVAVRARMTEAIQESSLNPRK